MGVENSLTLVLDYNEDKQYIEQEVEPLLNASLSMSRNLIQNENKGNINEAMIYFSTLGKYFVLPHQHSLCTLQLPLRCMEVETTNYQQ